MTKRISYESYLDSMDALGPTAEKPDASFNNIVFSTHFLLAEKILGMHPEFESRVLRHIRLTDTLEGGYAPKNSHDNLTAKIAALYASGYRRSVLEMDHGELSKGKHPRDWIYYGFLMNSGFKRFLFFLLMWFPMFEIVRGIITENKVRPAFWDSWKVFWFRVGAALGLYEEVRREESLITPLDYVVYFKTKDGIQRISYMINDGKILNLFRLFTLKHFWYFRWFVKLCKKLFVRYEGKNFQSFMLDRYFRLENHPVQQAYHALDKLNVTVLD